MAASIIQRIIGGTADNALVMSGSNFSRLVTLPATWTTLQLGIRWHTTTTALACNGPPRFYLGLGHGTTNIIGDYSTDNFIGLVTNTNWSTGVGIYTLGTNAYFAVTKVATTQTLSALALSTSATTAVGSGAASATADRVLLFVRLTKGSPNWTIDGFAQSSGTVTDVSRAAFLSQIIQAAPVLANHTDFTARTLAFDETPGALDTVQLSWDHTDVNLEICDLALALLA